MMKRISLFCCVLAAFLFTCGSGETLAEADTASPSELFYTMRRASAVLVVYPEEQVMLGEFLTKYFDSYNRSGDMKIILASDAEITKDDLIAHPLVLIGQFRKGVAAGLVQQLPFEMFDDHLVFDGRTYGEPEDMLRISYYPNPLDPYQPLNMVTGNDETALIEYLRASDAGGFGFMLLDNWGYQVVRKGRRIVLGNFSSEGPDKWTVNHKQHYTFDYEGKEVAASDWFRFIDHESGLGSSQIDSLVAYTNRNIAVIEEFLDTLPNKKYTYHIYKSTEMKGLMLNNTDQSQSIHETASVHAVYEREFGEHYRGEENCLLIRDVLGKPDITILESGLAALTNQKWEEKGVIYWALHFEEAGVAPSLADMLNNDSRGKVSGLLLQAKAALFVQFLREAVGDRPFESLYHSGATTLLAFEPAFKSYVAESLSIFDYHEPKRRYQQGFLKGFNFAHEGYQVYNGYLGTEAALSLEAVKATGANTVSLIPYTYTGELKKPTRLPFVNSPGTENDASIIRSAFVARELGMSVMLKPQVWSWNGWPGDFNMETEEEWMQFFHYYGDWIMHWAILAELYGIEYFCVGVEFVEATTQYPEAWRSLIRKVKAVYSGKVTYAANWGKEFETADIWEDLDFLSLNCYYPLNKEMEPDDRALYEGFVRNLEKINEVVERIDKPFLITEIGFRSITHPWLEPHAGEEGYEASEEAQNRCYKAMFDALNEVDYLGGIYLWKWPSYLDYTSENPTGFSPAGKAAEVTIKEWFKTKD